MCRNTQFFFSGIWLSGLAIMTAVTCVSWRWWPCYGASQIYMKLSFSIYPKPRDLCTLVATETLLTSLCTSPPATVMLHVRLSRMRSLHPQLRRRRSERNPNHMSCHAVLLPWPQAPLTPSNWSALYRGRGSPVMSCIFLKANNGQLDPGVGDKRFFRFKRNALYF